MAVHIAKHKELAECVTINAYVATVGPGSSSAAVVDDPQRMRPESGFGNLVVGAALFERGHRVSRNNAWNEFRQEVSSQGWSSDKSRAAFWNFKSSTWKKPWDRGANG